LERSRKKSFCLVSNFSNFSNFSKLLERSRKKSFCLVSNFSNFSNFSKLLERSRKKSFCLVGNFSNISNYLMVRVLFPVVLFCQCHIIKTTNYLINNILLKYGSKKIGEKHTISPAFFRNSLQNIFLSH